VTPKIQDDDEINKDEPLYEDDEGKTAAKSFPGENQPLSGLLSLRR